MRTADTTRRDRKTCTRCGDEWDEIVDVCHNCAGRLTSWLADPRGQTGQPRPIGAWRRRAREVMHDAVENYLDEHAFVDPDAILKLVDAAYPFGERAMHPYKAWLAERKILSAILLPPTKPKEPTVDDYGACLAAIDLVELGRDLEANGHVDEAKKLLDEARQLLDEQAPNRLGRKCPACGEYPGYPCIDRELATRKLSEGVRYNGGGHRTGEIETYHKRVERLIPHDARVEPKQPAPLPLFERSRT